MTRSSKLLGPTLFVAAIVSLAVGCSTMQYGDGKAGNVSLKPAVEKLAAAADAKLPGSGAMLRKYFATASAQRLPKGWSLTMEVRHRVTGAKIDLADYELVPVPVRDASTAIDPGALADLLDSVGTTNAAPADLIDALEALK